jgi:hypothetical protein
MAETYGRVLPRRKKKFAAPLLQPGHRASNPYASVNHNVGGGFLTKMDYQDPGKYPQLALSLDEG